jgi:hypothetical protein
MGLIGPPPPAPPMNSQPPPPPAPTVNITQPAIGNDGSSMREFMLAMTALQNNGYNRSNRIGLQFSDALDDPDFSSMSEAEQNAYIKRMFRNAEGMNSQSRFEDPDPEPEDIDQTDQALRDAGVTDDQIKNAKEIKNAKANGLKHGRENKNPTGKYKDMQEYKDAYAKGLEYFKKQEEEDAEDLNLVLVTLMKH